MKLRVIFRNDGPLVHCQDSPSYRLVSIDLTPEQIEKLKPRYVYSVGSKDYYEEISKCFLEEED
jgi:hypothetical protein